MAIQTPSQATAMNDDPRDLSDPDQLEDHLSARAVKLLYETAESYSASGEITPQAAFCGVAGCMLLQAGRMLAYAAELEANPFLDYVQSLADTQQPSETATPATEDAAIPHEQMREAISRIRQDVEQRMMGLCVELERDTLLTRYQICVVVAYASALVAGRAFATPSQENPVTPICAKLEDIIWRHWPSLPPFGYEIDAPPPDDMEDLQ
jgi:hypothetical protein